MTQKQLLTLSVIWYAPPISIHKKCMGRWVDYLGGMIRRARMIRRIKKDMKVMRRMMKRVMRKWWRTRSTQRVQTSLAEADQYSHILPTVKMLSLGCERLPLLKKKKKKKKKGSGSLPAPRSGYATTIMVFFGSFTHLTIPRSPPKFNQFFLVLLWTPP